MLALFGLTQPVKNGPEHGVEPAGTDTTSGALLAALQNPALGLLSPEQQDLFSRLHRQLSSQRRRQANRAAGQDDADAGAGPPVLSSSLLPSI